MGNRSIETYLELAADYISQENLNEAKKNAQIALKMDPESPKVRNLLGTIHFKESKYDLAETEYMLAINRAPRFWKPHYNLAILHHRLGNGRATLRKSLDAFLSSPNLETLYLSTELIINHFQRPARNIAALCFIVPLIYRHWISLIFTVILSIYCYAVALSLLKYQEKRDGAKYITIWVISVILHLLVVFFF